MAKYDLGKSSDRRRWAKAVAKDINKDLTDALKKEARRNPPTLPVQASTPSWSTSRSSSIETPWGAAQMSVHVNVDGQGNQVALGTQGDVHQQAVNTGLPPQSLVELIGKLRQAVPELGLQDGDAAEYQQAVDRVEQEAEQAEPNKGRMIRGLTAIRLFLEQGGGEATASLLPQVASMIQALGG